MSTEPEPLATVEDSSNGHALRVIGWFSAGVAAAALSIYVGFELRSRYKFKRRTPYDFYANAGERHPSEFGMGI